MKILQTAPISIKSSQKMCHIKALRLKETFSARGGKYCFVALKSTILETV